MTTREIGSDEIADAGTLTGVEMVTLQTAAGVTGTSTVSVIGSGVVVSVVSDGVTHLGRARLHSPMIDAEVAVDGAGDFEQLQETEAMNPENFPEWWVQPVTNSRFEMSELWMVRKGALGTNVWVEITA